VTCHVCPRVDAHECFEVRNDTRFDESAIDGRWCDCACHEAPSYDDADERTEPRIVLPWAEEACA
jgi:hypothetical protein